MQDLDVHLSGIVAGDPRAFAAWVAGAEARLRGSLRRFAAAVDAEAVLQETLLRAWQVAPRHEPDGRPDSLLRLAIRIARNLALDEVRRRRPDALEDEALERALDGEASSGVPGPDPLLRERIVTCWKRLRGRPAEAMALRVADGHLPDRVLAERLGVSLAAFHQAVTRARRQLAACLERAGVVLEEAWR